MELVDSHCHFEMLEPQDASHYIQAAKEHHVRYFLNVCVSIAGFPAVLQTAEAFNNVYASVGLHPNEQEEEVSVDRLVNLAQHPKVIAIGETGLDYYRSTGDLEWQRARFRAHIEAAKSVNKPLIIHMRDATEDTLRLMREEGVGDVRGVMHCFSEDEVIAKKAIDLGFYISFSGIVTFKNAQNIQAAAKAIPLESILVETDSPYLAPIPKRGKPNQPAYVRYTAEYIAALRDISLESFAEATTTNFFSLFKGAVKSDV